MSISPGMLIKESFEGRSGETARRAAPGFPILECAEFRWQAGGDEYFDSLRLAEVVGFPPGFKAFNNGRDSPLS
jgi:hypothetical protein